MIDNNKVLNCAFLSLADTIFIAGTIGLFGVTVAVLLNVMGNIYFAHQLGLLETSDITVEPVKEPQNEDESTQNEAESVEITAEPVINDVKGDHVEN